MFSKSQKSAMLVIVCAMSGSSDVGGGSHDTPECRDGCRHRAMFSGAVRKVAAACAHSQPLRLNNAYVTAIEPIMSPIENRKSL